VPERVVARVLRYFFISIVHRREGGLSDLALRFFQELYIVAVGKLLLLTLRVLHDRKLEIGVAEKRECFVTA
jgi:hypothetical protein